eukprot:PhF_6_TR37116/c2_g2_i1/m.54547
MTTAYLVAILLVFASAIQAKTVETLTPESFVALNARQEFWVVQFGFPWDPKVINTRSQLEGLAAALDGIVRVGVLPLDSRDALAIADLSIVRTFPEIVLLNAKYNRVDVPFGVGMYGYPVALPITYSGAITAEALEQWVIKYIPTRVPDLASLCLRRVAPEASNTSEILKSSTSAKVVFIGEEGKAAQVAVAANLKDKASFFRVPNSFALDIVGVDQQSNIVIIAPAGTIAAQFTREDWTTSTISAKISNSISQFPPRNSAARVAALDMSRRKDLQSFQASPVREITNALQYEKAIVKSINVVVAVGFVGPSQKDHERAMKALQTLALEAMSGVHTEFRIDFFYINAEKHKGIAKQVGVKRVPSLAFFLPVSKEGSKGIHWLDGPVEAPRARKFMAEKMLKPEGIAEYKAPSNHAGLWGPPSPVLNIESDECIDDEEDDLIKKKAKAQKKADVEKDDEEDNVPKKPRKQSKKEKARDEKIKQEVNEKKAARDRRIKEKAEKEAKEREAKKAANKKKLEKQAERKAKEPAGEKAAKSGKKTTKKKEEPKKTKKEEPKKESKKEEKKKDEPKREEKKKEEPKKEEKKKEERKKEEPKKEKKETKKEEPKPKTPKPDPNKLKKEKVAKEKEEAQKFAEQDGEFIDVSDF